MTAAHVYRKKTFKRSNCTATIKQNKITHNEMGANMKFCLLKSNFTAGNSQTKLEIQTQFIDYIVTFRTSSCD